MYVSAKYSCVGSTIALYTLHFLGTVITCCEHTRFQSPPNASEAASIPLLMSASMVLADATMLPRYMKFLTDSSGVQHVDRLRFVRVEIGRTCQFSAD